MSISTLPGGSEQSNEDPGAIVMETIKVYLSRRCRDILDYTAITGQKSIKISLYGLFQSYRSTESFPRFTDALSKALEIKPDLLSKIGFEIIHEASGEGFLVTSVENLRRICEHYEE
ncbi:MAG TPA: hypothetical protein VNL13_02895 [Sulfolobales archaeon]|nr:hypothetical protein [Sulfolobales archaeon]